MRHNTRLQAVFSGAESGIPTAQSISDAVLRQHKARVQFSDHILTAARSAVTGFEQEAERRVDRQSIPYVTIDDEYARDFDDAVAAEPDLSPANPGGHIVHVAIADVARYVLPGSPLDMEARARMFSIYPAGHAVPMLPPLLSERHCSLRENARRLAFGFDLTINSEGEPIDLKTARIVMRSRARLTYNKCDEFFCGNNDAINASLHSPLWALHAAYECLKNASVMRSELNIDRPEVTVDLDCHGYVAHMDALDKGASRDMIEKIMIATNAAAGCLLASRMGQGLFRIHEAPPSYRVQATRQRLEGLGFECPAHDHWTTEDLNGIRDQATDQTTLDCLQNLILNTITQSRYHALPRAHYGLNLPSYMTFTSPIRRYPDLIAQRLLGQILNLNPKGYFPGNTLPEISQGLIDHANIMELKTERIHADLQNRYGLAYLARRLALGAKPEMAARVIYCKDSEIRLSLKDYPCQWTVTPSHAFFNRLQEWINAERVEKYQKSDLISPCYVPIHITHADAGGDHIAFTVPPLPPRPARGSRPDLRLIS